MKIVLCENYDEISLKAAELIKEQLLRKPDSVLGFATGSTPVGTYKKLIEMFNNGEIDFKDVTSFNLDEYYPISNINEHSYHYFMNENLFKYINIPKDRIHILNGEADDPTEECDSYERQIAQAGGIDLQILGIGRNGHIGFNEPAQNLCQTTHLTALTDDTINANARFFESESLVPTYALTMGISTIFNAKKIILLASGNSKCNAIKTLFSDDISTNNPASVLKLHPDVTVICDYAAYDEK